MFGRIKIELLQKLIFDRIVEIYNISIIILL